MIYKIINSLDEATIEAGTADEVLACLAIIFLSKGKYGLEDSNGMMVCPVFEFARPERLMEWLTNRNISNESMDDFIASNGSKLATILESLAYGSVSDRREIKEKMDAMSADDATSFLAKWNNAKHPSPTELYVQALAMSMQLRKG